MTGPQAHHEAAVFYDLDVLQDVWVKRVIRGVANQTGIAIDHHLPHILGPRNQRPKGATLLAEFAALCLEIDNQRG